MLIKTLILLAISTVCHGQACPTNEVFSNCKDPCQPTCANKTRSCPIPNLLSCTSPGECVCKAGFIRVYAKGPCVELARCPTCGPNETPACYNLCQASCDNIDLKPCANATCQYTDCNCKPGYVRSYTSSTQRGSCIPKANCRPCGMNEQVVNCQASCEPTCATPFPKNCQTIPCGKPDCTCRKGYIRKVKGGPCQLKEECGSKCKKDEVLSLCDVPARCQTTCDKCGDACAPPRTCTRYDCVCKPGLIRLATNGLCIREDQCPTPIDYYSL